jgi:soluble lytic murein transglycosylase
LSENLPRVAAVAFMLILGTPAPDAGAARLGPPQGSSAWIRGQQLLERPGPALSEAIEARDQGDRLRAEWLLAEIALRHPIVGDHANRLRAQILLDQGRSAEAEEAVLSALEADPDSVLLSDLLALQGDALARQEHDEAARRSWRLALDTSRDAELRAALLLSTAASEERSGLRDEAVDTYRLLWRLYPLSDEADLAAARLEELRRRGREPLRTATDWRKRADSLFRARRNPQALEAYETALALGLSKSQATRAGRRRAQTLFRMRNYPDAVRAFADLRQVDDIPIWHARSLARADRVPEAIREFERIANQRRGGQALRARFLAALLLDGRGETERSKKHLESLTRTRATSSVRRAALWRLSWRSYREDRYVDAIHFIDQLILEEQDPIGRLRSRYWRARALSRLADDPQAAAAAQREFERIALEYPLTYYGWRARRQLPRDRHESVDAAELVPQFEAPEAGARRLSPEQLVRVRILLEAGLKEFALEELAGASRRASGLADRLELAQLFRSAGSFRSAQRLVLDPYKEELARGPSPTLEELWWHAWPAAYLDLVEGATREPGSVDAALVFSIMREESGFRPKVVSPVGARGLLQIMEPTGERLAAAVGHENFSADDLFEPKTNIRLGSHYLGELSNRFDGRLSAVIASYNAGPEAVSKWLAARADLDDDEWVEAIPYEQTRSYVKRVLRSLQAYRLLY